MSLVEFTSEAELRERYKAARRRVMIEPPPRQAPVVVIEPPPPIVRPPVVVTTDTRRPWQEREPTMPTIAAIKRLVGIRYNMTPADMISQRRTWNIVRPRQIAMYLCATLTPHGLPTIGRHFGGKDHTTILYARDQIKKRRLVEPELDATIKELEAELQG